MSAIITDGAAFLRDNHALIARYHRQLYPAGCTNPRCAFGCLRPAPPPRRLKEVIVRTVLDAVARHGGRQKAAARELGCALNTVRRHARKAARP